MGEYSRFTKREWYVLCVLCVVNFASSITTSIQAPFYPQEAEKKGATATEYGLVFGIYSLVAFIVCPVYGKYMDAIGVKLFLNVGVIVAGLSTMVFGLLQLVNEHAPFVGLSLVVRIIQSLGASAANTACFSITAAVFPGSVATIFATVEIFYGLGNIIGPTVGGYLFELGGFICPFMVLGGSLLVIEAFVYFALPNSDEVIVKDRRPALFAPFLKLRPIMLDIFSIATISMAFWFYGATLEPHLRQFNLSPTETGSVFICIGATYSVASPLVGRLCDVHVYPKKIIIFGCLMALIGFLLVGPVPYVPIEPNLWLICIGLVFQGLAMACVLVSSFIDGIRSAIECGLPDDISTYGMVSGIATSAFALGAFIGPSVAGALYDAVGFRQGTLFMVAMLIILFISMTWYVCTEQRPLSKRFDDMAARSQHETDNHALSGGNYEEESAQCPLIANGGNRNGYGSVSHHTNGYIEPSPRSFC